MWAIDLLSHGSDGGASDESWDDELLPCVEQLAGEHFDEMKVVGSPDQAFIVGGSMRSPEPVARVRYGSWR